MSYAVFKISAFCSLKKMLQIISSSNLHKATYQIGTDFYILLQR